MAAIFLNVDLEIESFEPLDRIVRELGEQVFVLFNGETDSGHFASFELSKGGNDPDSMILQFCELIRNLPPDANQSWDRSFRRSLDIGYEVEDGGESFRSEVKEKTVQKVAEVGATLAMTLYPTNYQKGEAEAPNEPSG